MSRHPLERLRVPAPVLQHLAGGLQKVPLHGVAGKLGGLGPCADDVHGVPELVEEDDDLVVLQQRRLRRRRLRQVGHQSGDARLENKVPKP